MKKRLFLFLPLLGMLLGGCSGGIEKVTGITLDKTELTVMVSESQKITATIEPVKALNQIITWESSCADIATVSTGGVVTGVSTGSAVIKAITEDGGFSASCNVTVTPYVPVVTHVTNIALSSSKLNMEPEDTSTITYTVFPEDATYKDVIIASSNEDIATIERLEGNQFKVTAVGEGKTSITVTSTDTPEEGKNVVTAGLAVDVYKQDEPGVVHVSSISVSSPTQNLLVGQSADFTYEVLPKDATDKTVSVLIGDESVASMSHDEDNNKISLSAKKVGSTKVTITANDKPHGEVISREVTVNVTEPVAVTGVNLNPEEMSLNIGQEMGIVATVLPENATNKKVDWSSDNPSVAVYDDGKVKALSEGKASITVKTQDGGFTKSCAVTVAGVKYDTVYFTNNFSWSNVEVHSWGIAGDNYVTMTKAYVNDIQQDVYKAKVPTCDSFQFTDHGDNYTEAVSSFKENTGYYVIEEKDADNNWKIGSWSVVPYTINYYANGGVGTMDSVTAYNGADNGGWMLNDNKFTKDGYYFKGWATSESGDVVYTNKAIVPNNTITVPGSELNLYAKWQESTGEGYKLLIGSTNYDLVLNEGDEYVTATPVSVKSGDTIKCFNNGEEITGYLPKKSSNNNCWNDNGTVKVCLNIEANIYVDVKNKTIMCNGLEVNKYYLSVNNCPFELTPNGTTFDGYDEYMLIGHEYHTNDAIKCVNTSETLDNATVFTISIVNPSSIPGFSYNGSDAIVYTGGGVNADTYVKFKYGMDEIYFGLHK
ncbi:MAG: Ig-like domain-containing protein [Bacilli bacterium]|nr:Ig-like domain-containing protein [Bacilli bacterium]